MMFKRIFPVFTAFLALAAAVSQAQAAESCGLQPELIFELRKPEYGAYNVWDTVYGDMITQEKFVSGFVLENGDLIVAGEQSALGKDDKTLLLAQVGDRGRLSWNVKQTVPGLASVRKVLAAGQGFVVLGEVNDKSGRSSVWLGFFDAAGKLTAQQTVSDKYSLGAEDMIAQISGGGYVLSATADSGKSGIHYAILYHLDPKGRVTQRHAYIPGAENRILGLSADGRDAYLMSGYIRADDGRLTGWLAKIDRDGNFIWQNQYVRGTASQIARAMPVVRNLVIAIGGTNPKGGGKSAGWVMGINDNNGNVVWQRYYTGELDQTARDVLVNMEGLSTVMIQALRPDNAAPDSDQSDYVRLLTINARGALAISDEYFNAEGADGYQLIGGHAGERIIIGDTNVRYEVEKKADSDEPKTVFGHDGWVLAAAPMEEYDDPCLSSPQ